MEISGQIANGIFIYDYKYKYTKGDIVLYYDEDLHASRLFHVESAVSQINPMEDDGTHFVDYFKKIYGDNLVTKSTIKDEIGKYFNGLSGFDIDPIEADPDTISKSGVYTFDGKTYYALSSNSGVFMAEVTTVDGFSKITRVRLGNTEWTNLGDSESIQTKKARLDALIKVYESKYLQLIDALNSLQ